MEVCNVDRCVIARAPNVLYCILIIISPVDAFCWDDSPVGDVDDVDMLASRAREYAISASMRDEYAHQLLFGTPRVDNTALDLVQRFI